MANRLTRRYFLKPLFGGAASSLLVEPGLFKVETVQLSLNRLSKAFSGFRVVQISDVHMGGWMNGERLQQVVDIIESQHPDVLLITGDFVVGHEFTESTRKSLNDFKEVISPLVEFIPTYAVLGNHDYWTNAHAVRDVLAASGIVDLTNSVFTITRNEATLHLCGVDDIRVGNVRLDEVIAQLNDDGAAILLAHEPDYADISARTGKFDLQVSGHTHGGQIVLPFFGPPILPYLGRKYPNGLYEIGSMYQYTNRGVGMGSLHLRWNCSPEITLFILESPGS